MTSPSAIGSDCWVPGEQVPCAPTYTNINDDGDKYICHLGVLGAKKPNAVNPVYPATGQLGKVANSNSNPCRYMCSGNPDEYPGTVPLSEQGTTPNPYGGKCKNLDGSGSGSGGSSGT